jgi:hypothetical protein
MNKKGWFVIPGVQQGDRAIAEQLMGLERLMGLVDNKTVLDLGCAEGAIAHACLDHGAVQVLGIDNNEAFINRARNHYGHDECLAYEMADLNHWPKADAASVDVLLLLAILHKLADPAKRLRAWSNLVRDWIVIRLPIGSTGEFASKHFEHRRCDVSVELRSLGFVLEDDVDGPRGERVHYWRRVTWPH